MRSSRDYKINYKIKGTASRERAKVLQKHQSLIDPSLAAPGNR